MKQLICLGISIVGIFSGCQSGGAYLPKNTDKYNVESSAKFVLLDHMVQRSVTVTEIQERILEDGRLEVTANVRNREGRRIQVQVNCVFKDESGFSTGDETPFQTLILTERATEAVRFTSMNNKARRYTIRVRQAH
ncbi:MAG: YcfL family protein [Verrucomicrobiota bacterium]|nr:YcfL family protein [Verrucomicrobiota bacterium]